MSTAAMIALSEGAPSAMQYRIDPKSGNRLSTLGFGCMRFPRNRALQIDLGRTERLIKSAVENGVNYFDTAYVYGGSEEVLGELLHKNKLREKIFIATKLPFQKCKEYEDFDRLFKTQLERLKTDYIDYYLIHYLSDTALWTGIRDLGVEKWIAAKKASGQIKQIGFSFHGMQSEFLALLDAYDWDFCQIQYNYVNVHDQAGRIGLRKAAEKGLPVIIMEPLLGGKLATGLPQKSVKLFKEADEGLTPAQWALRWLWDQDEVTVVLSGMNSDEQLRENIKTAEHATPHMFDEREAGVFGPVVAAFRESYKIPCTSCNYCMPCPQRVNIPACFAAYNMSYTVGFLSGLQQYIIGTGATDAAKDYSGRHCVECGKCEEQCPQHIAISKELKAVTKRMEPFWFRTAIRLIVRFRG
jgi:predicted aldo/keto reductase-like oxidoreductase